MFKVYSFSVNYVKDIHNISLCSVNKKFEEEKQKFSVSKFFYEWVGVELQRNYRNIGEILLVLSVVEVQVEIKHHLISLFFNDQSHDLVDIR